MSRESTPRSQQSAPTTTAQSTDETGIDPVVTARTLRDTQLLLESHLDDARLLQELSASLVGHYADQDMYEQFVDAAKTLMHADFASMQMLRTDESGLVRLELIAERGFVPEAVEFWHWVEGGEASACGMALAAGARVIIEDVDAEPAVQGTSDLEMYHVAGMRSVQSTPLRSRTGRSLGMISTHWRQPHTPSERELRLFDILARQAADLLEQRAEFELLTRRERELEEALTARNDFLGLVSHELRTPIAIISANVELMRRAVEQDDCERLGDIHREMNENIDRISRTVDNMLALARIEAGIISDLEPVLPARLAERVAASHRRWHPGRVISVIDNSSLRPVLSHADHIEQALDNLLSNALKYSEGPIEIEVIEVRPGPIGSGAASSDVADTASNESWITAHVRDPGIPADVVGALFQPFTRSDEHASVAGIGLGLNVCRRLIEVHHGRIWAENRPDGGADFAFSLPAAAAPFD